MGHIANPTRVSPLTRATSPFIDTQQEYHSLLRVAAQIAAPRWLPNVRTAHVRYMVTPCSVNSPGRNRERLSRADSILHSLSYERQRQQR
ncbi:hypothetical protein PsYK624_010640 [Phanerochaete sordida]|uniref:Uncharacterized protein n=1 Tax=Phanerochaete sordida TaxID=48140 RepID=A0A9P3L8S6_9APHY|nr:hypothetical protein PsYK624_010640 [Phanerochaete sordida]